MKALLIGINYYDTPSSKLNGCINDVVNMRNMLIDAYGYDSADITVLRDDAVNATNKPTKANIISQLTSIISQSVSLNQIWIHYSGHGSQIQDTNSDEADKKDEVIVPSDFSRTGFITDDIIFNIVKQSQCPTVLIFDSCNSGTVCDLMWNFNATSATQVNAVKTNNTAVANPNILCFSGCRDEQTSAETYNANSRQSSGAMTNAIMECLRLNKHNVNIKKLYTDVVSFILQTGLSQVPQLSSSRSIPTYQITRLITTSKEAVGHTISTMTVRNVMKDVLR